MHSEEGLNRLPLGAVCFLWHYDDTVCSAGIPAGVPEP